MRSGDDGRISKCWHCYVFTMNHLCSRCYRNNWTRVWAVTPLLTRHGLWSVLSFASFVWRKKNKIRSQRIIGQTQHHDCSCHAHSNLSCHSHSVATKIFLALGNGLWCTHFHISTLDLTVSLPLLWSESHCRCWEIWALQPQGFLRCPSVGAHESLYVLTILPRLPLWRLLLPLWWWRFISGVTCATGCAGRHGILRLLLSVRMEARWNSSSSKRRKPSRKYFIILTQL